jgi:hypothetical protein
VGLFRPLFWDARPSKPSLGGFSCHGDSIGSFLLNLLPALKEQATTMKLRAEFKLETG